MSFLVSLSNFLPLSETKNTFFSAQSRPHSYHPATNSTALPRRQDHLPSNRESVSSEQSPQASSNVPITSVFNSNQEIEFNSSSNELPAPIRSPPPAYIHDPTRSFSTETTSQQDDDSSPPRYEHSLHLPTNSPQRSSSCSARISSTTNAIPGRQSANRRVSFAPSTSTSSSPSHRNSLLIDTSSTARPSLETCYSGLSSLPPLENEHQLVTSPPRLSPTLHQPLSSHPVTRDASREKWDYDCQTLAEKKEKEGTWCCGVLWAPLEKTESERRRRVMNHEGYGGEPMAVWIF